MNKQANVDEEYLRVLNKGLITLPVDWREEMGIDPGSIIVAKMTDGKIILEPQKKFAPVRSYSDDQIDQFVKDDALSPALIKKLNEKGIY